MKVGSLVISLVDYYAKNVWYIAKDTILEVRTIGEGSTVQNGTPGIAIRFIGIINGIAPIGVEYAYCGEYFQEIQPPMEVSIEAILEETITI